MGEVTKILWDGIPTFVVVNGLTATDASLVLGTTSSGGPGVCIQFFVKLVISVSLGNRDVMCAECMSKDSSS